MLAVKSTASLHCLLTLIILEICWLRWNRQPLKPTSFLFQVSAWGGYVFIINLIPLHVFVLLLMNRYSERIYVAYNTFFIIGLLCSMQIPFVGFQPVKTSEHMASAGKEYQVQGILVFIPIAMCISYISNICFRCFRPATSCCYIELPEKFLDQIGIQILFLLGKFYCRWISLSYRGWSYMGWRSCTMEWQVRH